jgi:hypothetical protein
MKVYILIIHYDKPHGPWNAGVYDSYQTAFEAGKKLCANVTATSNQQFTIEDNVLIKT